MAKLDEVLKLVRLYEEKYRHPSLTRFSVSNKYDLLRKRIWETAGPNATHMPIGLESI